MSVRQTFIDRIYDGVDPFASYKAIKPETATLPEGWGSTHPYFKQYIDQLKPKLIVEVGTWLGGSAIHMGHQLHAAGLNDSCIICVDTWLGSSEHFLYPDGRATLKLVNGRATFYDDLIYLDGDHTARGFRADLDLYWALLSPGGALIGDDFDWDEVQANVINFAYLEKVEFSSFDNKFAFRKPL